MQTACIKQASTLPPQFCKVTHDQNTCALRQSGLLKQNVPLLSASSAQSMLQRGVGISTGPAPAEFAATKCLKGRSRRRAGIGWCLGLQEKNFRHGSVDEPTSASQPARSRILNRFDPLSKRSKASQVCKASTGGGVEVVAGELPIKPEEGRYLPRVLTGLEARGNVVGALACLIVVGLPWVWISDSVAATKGWHHWMIGISILAVIQLAVWNAIESVIFAEGLRYEPRNLQLAPDWHNLFDREGGKTVYYNSVTQIVQQEQPNLLPRAYCPPENRSPARLLFSYFFGGVFELVFKPLLTAALCALVFGSQVVMQLKALHMFVTVPTWYLDTVWPVILQAVSFSCLPQPLPFIPILFSQSQRATWLQSSLAAGFETTLCVALVAVLLFEVLGFLKTMARAARARVRPMKVRWEASFGARFLLAFCPPLNWRLQPYAFHLDFKRVVLVRLPLNFPLALPVPKLELFTQSWRAMLHAMPLVIPLTRVLVQAARTSDFRGLLLSTMWTRPVQIGIVTSVMTVLLRELKAAYETALEHQAKEDQKATEELMKRELAAFDNKLLQTEWQD